MEKAYYVGPDLAKKIFQGFTADEKGRKIGNKKMSGKAMVEFFSKWRIGTGLQEKASCVMLPAWRIFT
ncbi:MAG: hypothetical protein LBN96_05325 [Desulfovibrio sp.]|jgi:hypothetical protein|nr:hypothetical protein [Desulfovibrio sp.]